MLDVIGAGTSISSASATTDFDRLYMSSELNAANVCHIETLCSASMSQKLHLEVLITSEARTRASWYQQFIQLFYKVSVAYWRTPSYNLVRFLVNILIALIFSSAYAQKTYNSSYEIISRSAVIFITVLFTGVVGILTVIPVTLAERPSFYRQQDSEMYSVAIYAFVTSLVEVR